MNGDISMKLITGPRDIDDAGKVTDTEAKYGMTASDDRTKSYERDSL